MSIELIGIEGFPIVEVGDNLGELIYKSLTENSINLRDDDILVIAETVVSKAEGNIIEVDSVKPTEEAYKLSDISGKDANSCQIILDNTKKIIKKRGGLIITETPHGFVCANSGIDNSNCEDGFVTPLPINPDKSARKIKEYLDSHLNCDSKIIISDTHGRAWRVGAIGVAVGISGLKAVTDFRGSKDLYGNELTSTIEGTADELASAASLIMGQSDEGMCLVLVRGYDTSLVKCNAEDSSIDDIIRDESEDVFR